METSATVPAVNVRNAAIVFFIWKDTNVLQRILMCSYFWIDQNIINVCILHLYDMQESINFPQAPSTDCLLPSRSRL